MSRDPPLVEPTSVGLIDRAETFEESGVTLTHAGTDKVPGSVELTQATATTDPDSEGYTSSDPSGVLINVKEDIGAVEARLGSDYSGEASDAMLKDHSDGSTLDSTDISSLGPGDTFQLSGEMESGEDYRVVIDDAGNNYSMGRNPDPNWPYESDLLDITDGILGGTALNYRYAIDQVTGYASPGEVIIEYEQPEDIYRWDSVLFQATEDGEAVTVDVQESTDGGDSWTTIATDVSRGQEITADPSSEVRFRVQLTRSNPSNNPTLDAAYRRYVV